MDSQLISGHYSIPGSRPFTGVPGPFGLADDAQPETNAEDAPACIADAASMSRAMVPYEPSLTHDVVDAPPPRSPRKSRRARVFAFAAGTVAIVASLPCIEKRLEPAVVPTSVAQTPIVRPTPPIHAASPLVLNPAAQPLANATVSESPHALQRAAQPSRRVVHAVEPVKRSRLIGHPVAHEARAEHWRTSRSFAARLPEGEPLSSPAQPDSATPPQWEPHTQTRLIDG